MCQGGFLWAILCRVTKPALLLFLISSLDDVLSSRIKCKREQFMAGPPSVIKVSLRTNHRKVYSCVGLMHCSVRVEQVLCGGDIGWVDTLQHTKELMVVVFISCIAE